MTFPKDRRKKEKMTRQERRDATTIRRRLKFSNLIMFTVPLVTTLLAAIVCIFSILFMEASNDSIGIRDTENFERMALAITEEAQRELLEMPTDPDPDFSVLQMLTDVTGFMVDIQKEQGTVFVWGEVAKDDRDLIRLSGTLSGEVLITHNERSLYFKEFSINDDHYTIRIYGGNQAHQVFRDFKQALIMAAILLGVVIILAFVLTNRFLIRYIYKRIENPLGILSGGVTEISEGNFDYRIHYPYKDEFSSVCNDFNHMAEELKNASKMLRAEEKSRKELLAGISHDIRSPLTSIKAYVEGLQDGVASSPEAQKKYLKVIHDKANDLDKMISQLFLLSKMELGEFQETAEDIRLDETIRDLVSAEREEFLLRGLTISEEMEEAVVHADPAWIHRLIINILENSLKYKNREMGHVSITLKNLDEKWCELTMADDGPGAPEYALAHLFDVFYRGDASRTNPGKGSGLGLAIVKNIVEHMGGSCRCENAQAGGLVMIFTFLRKESHEDPDH